MIDNKMNRRQWIAGSAALVAGGYAASARGFRANETINLACIGTGGRCRQLMGPLAKIDGVRIAGVCDVWDDHLAAGAKLADSRAVQVKEFERILDRKDIDAVLIATPDHWHVPITIAACEAGKDVYVEKPLTHDLAEGAAVIRAQNNHRRVVQVGMQQRSMPHIQRAKQIVDSGQLGKIHKVHLTWNRNAARGANARPDVDPSSVDWKRFLGGAPDQPFDPYRFRNWRWLWDFGGGILTDLMTHFVDVAHWFLDLDAPELATTIGDHFQRAGIWEAPDTIQTLIRYPDRQVQVYFEGTFFNARNRAMMEFMGEQATLYVDRGRYEIHPERKSKVEYSEMVLGSGDRGLDFYLNPNGEVLHLTNWIESIRSRQTPAAPAEVGVSAVFGPHLGNLAYRSGEVARWSEVAPA